MLMCHFCKKLNIQNGQCRVCNGLTKHQLGIRLKCRIQLFFRCIR